MKIHQVLLKLQVNKMLKIASAALMFMFTNAVVGKNVF